jgi:trans-aconitate methyltransferase
MSAPDWNAERYHVLSEPQWQWGLKVLSELTLEGSEVVLDAGCGTGRLTAVLLERLPKGRVIALDASAPMLEVARRELSRFGEQVAFVQGDLGALTLSGVADVVFSTATFHWVLAQDALYGGLFRALKGGGRLHAQCGGEGNLAGFLALAMTVGAEPSFAEHLAGFTYPAVFPGAQETAHRLTLAGFEQVRAWLTPAPTPFPGADAFRAFTSTVVLRHVLARLPKELVEPYLDRLVAVAEASPLGLSLDYVRLELRATKPR